MVALGMIDPPALDVPVPEDRGEYVGDLVDADLGDPQ